MSRLRVVMERDFTAEGATRRLAIYAAAMTVVAVLPDLFGAAVRAVI